MSDLDKLTTEKPPSSIELHKPTRPELTIDDAISSIDNIYKYCDPEVQVAYKKGGMSKIAQDTSAENVLQQVVDMYIDTVREKINCIDNQDLRKQQQIDITNIQRSLSCLITMLNKDDFKLDINSVIHIIHGYVNTNVEKIFEHYETRRRFTHRHDSHIQD